MRASEVRGKVLADHALLGELLRRAGQHGWRVLGGEADARQPLCNAVFEIADPLLKHLDLEESLVRPIIEPIAEWGPMDLLQMRVNHAHQRDYLGALVEFARDPHTPPNLLAAEVISFVREMIEDMTREEHALLHPDTRHADRALTG